MTTSAELVITDSHVHYWDLEANPWYPALQHPEEYGLPATGLERMLRTFLPPDHREEYGAIRLGKAVHVSATTAPRAFLDEVAWVESVAAEHGLPNAFIGTVDVSQDATTMRADLARQAASHLFRGVRVLEGLEPGSELAAALVDALADDGWVFDVVVRPSSADAWLPLLRRRPDLRVVVEHVAWPEGTTDSDRQGWQEALRALAELEHVHCKISGLPMTLHTMDAETLRPWIEEAIAAFGAHRCLFGSNFPVDAPAGTAEQLVTVVRTACGNLDDAELHGLLAANAEALYQL